MAKNENLQTRRDGVTFEEDTLAFCKKIYAEADQRRQTLRDINIENLEFYQGIDKQLLDRKMDSSMVRSALFVNELSSAVDARVGDLIASVDEDEYPYRLRPTTGPIDDATRENIAFAERELNEQLRSCGYLSDVLTEQFLAAEILRVPSVVKVGVKKELIDEAYVFDPPVSITDRALSMFGMRKLPDKQVKYRKKEVVRPFVEWIPPDELLYEPGRSVYPDDFTYMGHAIMLTREEIYALAKEFDFDQKKLDKFFDEEENSPQTKVPDAETIQEEVEADKDTPLDETGRYNRFEIVEWYVTVYSDSGNLDTWKVVVIENKEMLYKERWNNRELQFPFIMLVANRQLGSCENISTIDKCKDLQRLHSEGFNALIDGMTYRIFPPFKNKIGNTLQGQPVYGPGRIWNIQDPEQFTSVLENPGQMPDLLGVIEYSSAKIRDTASAPDISEGVAPQGGQYEKATKTNLRAMGTARRNAPIKKRYGNSMIAVGECVMALNRQHHDEAYRFVVPVRVDVPSLTSVSDPTQEKQDLLLIYSQMLSDPLFQTPNGMRKRRAVFEDLVRMVKKTGWERIVLTEQELELQIKDQAAMESNMLTMQALSQQGAMQQQMNPPMQESNNESVLPVQ